MTLQKLLTKKPTTNLVRGSSALSLIEELSEISY